MREISIEDSKATLSAVVDEALRGEEFAITRHPVDGLFLPLAGAR